MKASVRAMALAAGLLLACGDDDPGMIEPRAATGPCGEVPTAGRCLGDTVETCVVATGSGAPSVVRYDCLPDERCDAGPVGAHCVLDAECLSGDSACSDPATLTECVQGRWVARPCPGGCVGGRLEASCAPTVPTVRYGGVLSYEFRGVNSEWTDWSPGLTTATAPGFLILSVANGEVIDAAVTGTTVEDAGRYVVDAVPAWDADGDDFLVAVAASAREDGALAYAMMDPGLPPGEYAPPLTFAEDAELWLWSWTVAELPSGDAHIPEASGSAAARLFDYMRFAHDFAGAFYGPRPDAGLVTWLGAGVTWTCGACFTPAPTVLPWGEVSDAQIFIPGGADASWWSGAVTAHELGHWVMSTYGRSPGEGGEHIAGIPSHPGLAWSEGWATWFSSVVRDSAVYYDKQDGVFFWIDLAARAYSLGQPWLRPEARFGLEQLIDENEVARTLLALTTESSIDGMLAALAWPRMTAPPFARGYRTRLWDGLDANGLPLPFEVSDLSAPFLADYLDALVCGGVVTPSDVDAVTEPAVHYPYPAHAPLCSSGGLPIRVAFDPAAHKGTGPVTLSASARWDIPLERPMTMALALPDGAKLLQGPARAEIPPGPPGEERWSWTLLAPDGVDGLTLSVATGGEGWVPTRR